jgi:hypothetical protein
LSSGRTPGARALDDASVDDECRLDLGAPEVDREHRLGFRGRSHDPSVDFLG